MRSSDWARLSLRSSIRKQAIDPLHKAVALDPKSADAHFVLGTALRQSGHQEEGTREQKISLELQNQKVRTESQSSPQK